MSSIIFLEAKERNRLAISWKNQVIDMENKLKNLKKEAIKLGDDELISVIEKELNKLKKDFDFIFDGASNKKIIKEMDLKYWDAGRVNNRLRVINEKINRLDLSIKEQALKREFLQKRLLPLKKQINKYSFLSYLDKELQNIENLSIKDLNLKLEKIENEIDSKLSIYNKVKKGKSSLKKNIDILKNNIDKYSFLKEYNEELLFLEKELEVIEDLDIDKLNNLVNEFNSLKNSVAIKESTILNGIDSIKEYKILEEEVKEIGDLNINNKSEEKVIKQYNKFLEKLKFYSLREAERIEKLDIPLENKLLELKLTYQQEKKKYLISTKLQEIKAKYKNDEKFLEQFSHRIEEVLKNNEEYEFYNLLYDIEIYDSRKKVIQEQIALLKEKLMKLGYSFQGEVEIGKKGYINTDDKKLKVKYLFNENGINFVFVRVGNDNISYDEEIKTLQKAKKWCRDFDKLNEELKKEGIELFDEDKKESIFRKEPEAIKDIIFEELESEEEYEETTEISQKRYIEESE
jgi:hypothetical protein